MFGCRVSSWWEFPDGWRHVIRDLLCVLFGGCFLFFFVFVAMVCDYALIGLNLLPSSLRGLSARAGFVGGGRPKGPPFWAKAEDSPPRFRP